MLILPHQVVFIASRKICGTCNNWCSGFDYSQFHVRLILNWGTNNISGMTPKCNGYALFLTNRKSVTDQKHCYLNISPTTHSVVYFNIQLCSLVKISAWNPAGTPCLTAPIPCLLWQLLKAVSRLSMSSQKTNYSTCIFPGEPWGWRVRDTSLGVPVTRDSLASVRR